MSVSYQDGNEVEVPPSPLQLHQVPQNLSHLSSLTTLGHRRLCSSVEGRYATFIHGFFPSYDGPTRSALDLRFLGLSPQVQLRGFRASPLPPCLWPLSRGTHPSLQSVADRALRRLVRRNPKAFTTCTSHACPIWSPSSQWVPSPSPRRHPHYRHGSDVISRGSVAQLPRLRCHLRLQFLQLLYYQHSQDHQSTDFSGQEASSSSLTTYLLAPLSPPPPPKKKKSKGTTRSFHT